MTTMLCAGILQAVLLTTGANETAAAVPETGSQPAASAQPAAKAAKADSYDEAHRVTTETGKPIVVMVGTDWCGPCQAMKKTVLPRVRERGLLKKVAFALVNADRDHDLAEKLTGGGPVPQLVMFRKTSNGWMRRKLVGGQSVETVEEFINEGLAQDEADKKAHGDMHDEHHPASDAQGDEKTDEASQHG